MKGRKILAGILSAVMAIGAMAISAYAEDSDSASAWGGADGTTVKVGENYFKTLNEALTFVYKNGPYDSAVTVECKENADVGTMTHAHVEDDLVIIGNGAYVSNGERDLEFDTYIFSRETGSISKTGEYLQKDVTVKVDSLNGIAAWGERHTDFAVNVEFNNCKNMQRVYISGTHGSNNIKLTDCSFARTLTGDAAYPQGDNTSVYSNNPGEIVINNCDFNGIPAAVNLNNKSNGKQNITITDCRFTDCSTTANASSWAAFAAPLRFVTQNGAESNVTVNSCTIAYSKDSVPVGNGGILLGDGRNDKASTEKVTLNVSGTAAELQIHDPEKGKIGSETLTEADTKTITMEQSTAVAKIGDQTYATMAEAINAAPTGDTVTTITVIGKADVANSAQLKNKKITFVGDPSDGDDELVFTDGTAGEWTNAYYADNSDFTFEDLTLTWSSNGGYQGFVRPNSIVYNRCTINEEFYLAGNSQIFNSCTFNQTKSNLYNVWTYGALKAEFNGCKFNSAGKSVLVYKEGSGVYSDVTPFDVKITDCEFHASEAVGKAAVEIDSSLSPFTVSIDSSSEEGFSEGTTSGNTLYNVKKMNTDLSVKDKTSLTVNGEAIDLKPIREKTTWTSETDSGFYTTETGKFGMMRFMFSVVPNGTVKKAGIKYVSAGNLDAESTESNTVSEDGNITVFQGDIVAIPDSVSSEANYYAVAYVETENGIFWSNPTVCSVNWKQHFTDYTPGGVN